MIVTGNPGMLVVLIFYFFIIQGLFVICGFISKSNRRKILNLNILIGLTPCFFIFSTLVRHIKIDFWVSWDSIFLYLILCGVINVLLLSLEVILKVDLVKYRWCFFTYISVIGSYLFSFLLLNR